MRFASVTPVETLAPNAGSAAGDELRLGRSAAVVDGVTSTVGAGSLVILSLAEFKVACLEFASDISVAEPVAEFADRGPTISGSISAAFRSTSFVLDRSDWWLATPGLGFIGNTRGVAWLEVSSTGLDDDTGVSLAAISFAEARQLHHATIETSSNATTTAAGIQ
jgi:hypothetical protein